jgi:hypothetical protein
MGQVILTLGLLFLLVRLFLGSVIDPRYGNSGAQEVLSGTLLKVFLLA